mgnify:CR=1 FL=1
MPYRVTFVVDLFHGSMQQALGLGHRALHRMLGTLVEIDCDYLRAHPEVPPLYESGVRYQVEPKGKEDWQDIPTCLKLGVGDCEDLACWRCAELIVRGRVDAKPTFLWKKIPGGTLYHIQVLTAQGIEDPSRVLGMQ